MDVAIYSGFCMDIVSSEHLDWNRSEWLTLLVHLSLHFVVANGRTFDHLCLLFAPGLIVSPCSGSCLFLHNRLYVFLVFNQISVEVSHHGALALLQIAAVVLAG